MAKSVENRSVCADGKVINYQLERKEVRNLNLRVRKDGSVYVSAHWNVPEEEIDAFVEKKRDYIFRSLAQFREMTQFHPNPKAYVSGETFFVQGHSLRLKVIQGKEESVRSDGVYLYLQVKDPTDFSKKQKLVIRYLDSACKSVFQETMEALFPAIKKYGFEMPQLRIRDMETRWGSCIAKKGIITLNKRLIEAPQSCIEYVVMHELCHLMHPNHSKQFYQFLTMMMPDWKERKTVLEKNAVYWL